MRTFDEMTDKAENDMYAFCLRGVGAGSNSALCCPIAKVHQRAFRKPGRLLPPTGQVGICIRLCVEAVN